MFENKIPPRSGNANLADYEAARSSFSWDDTNAFFSWHTTGKVNIGYEAIDRHAEDPNASCRPCLVYRRGERVTTITYGQMQLLSNRLGNALRGLGVGKGDRVFLFLPSLPELYIALAGCAKIGAIIVPLYSNFREAAVKARMLDGRGKFLITTSNRRAHVPAEEFPDLEHIIIVGDCTDPDAGELWWEDLIENASEDLEIEWVDREDPLFLIYTSGQDGRPIGLVHVHDAMRGYLITARWALDIRAGDVVWTQAQPGWLMNVVYSAFAPWLCGATSFVTGKMHDACTIYRFIQDHRIAVLYTIPTVYRILAAAGEELPRQFDLTSLRHLASVVEPLFPDLIYTLMRILGLPVHDTWWTAETGMITLANFPCLPIKPGYLGKPLPGITATVLDEDGQQVPFFTMGNLALKQGWPAMVRGIWEKADEYRRYFRHQGWFVTDDTAFVDHDGYFFHQGRTDDVIITAAGKTGFAEIEKTLQQHPAVAEAAVIRVHHTDEQRKLKAFIRLKPTYRASPLLQQKIMTFVKNNFSPDIAPQEIQFCEDLPRDQNGTILRRVLKAWELGLPVRTMSL
ncbi:MAG: AMP-binding protein [Desulfobacterota bacterium]|nr:AMP-binding protein [Thermodesulfobacteriota bacterium]